MATYPGESLHVCHPVRIDSMRQTREACVTAHTTPHHTCDPEQQGLRQNRLYTKFTLSPGECKRAALRVHLMIFRRHCQTHGIYLPPELNTYFPGDFFGLWCESMPIHTQSVIITSNMSLLHLLQSDTKLMATFPEFASDASGYALLYRLTAASGHPLLSLEASERVMRTPQMSSNDTI
jgi:hypothetical protein